MTDHLDERIATHLEDFAGSAADSLVSGDFTRFIVEASTVVRVVAEGLDCFAGRLGKDEEVTPRLKDEAKALREAAGRVLQLVDPSGYAAPER